MARRWQRHGEHQDGRWRRIPRNNEHIVEIQNPGAPVGHTALPGIGPDELGKLCPMRLGTRGETMAQHMPVAYAE